MFSAAQFEGRITKNPSNFGQGVDMKTLESQPMPHRWKDVVQTLIPMVVLAVGLLFPLGWVILKGWTLTGLYEESVGYRYFYSLRILYDVNAFVFLPQAQLVGIVNQVIQGLLTALGYPPDVLFPRIDLFSYITVAVPHLVAVAAFAWAVTPLKTSSGKLCAALFWLLPYYVWSLYYPGGHYIIQPDYHVWIIPVGLVVAGGFARWPVARSRWQIRDAIVLGVFVGLVAGIKITLLIFPATIGLGWLLSKRGWRRSFVMGLCALTTGGLVWLFVLFTYYRGDLHHVLSFFHYLSMFIGSAHTAQPYWEWLQTASTHFSWLVRVTIILPVLLLGLAFSSRRDHLRMDAFVGLSVGAAAYHWVLYSRFVPATWFEVLVFLQVAVWASIMVLWPKKPRAFPWDWAGVAGCLLVITWDLPFIMGHFGTLRLNHQANEQFQQGLSDIPGRTAFLIPTNTFRPLTVDSAIFKGGSNIFEGCFGASAFIRRMFPEREYFAAPQVDYYKENPLNLSAFSKVVFAIPDGLGLDKKTQIRNLEEHYSTSLAFFLCDQDFDFSRNNQNIVICTRREREEITGDTKGLSAFYLPVTSMVSPGVPVVAASGETVYWDSGDMVLSGYSGELVHFVADGWIVRLTGQEGQKIRISNVGMWDSKGGTFAGLDAVYKKGRWVIDNSAMQPSNPNNRFREGSKKEPIPGFWISSPGEAGYTTMHIEDENGSFIRVQATRPSSYLVINGNSPLAGLQGVPVSIRGQIRAHSTGKSRLTLFDVVAENGRSEDYTVYGNTSEEWTTLTVQVEKILYPDPGDNFSLGLEEVEAGDWFDVRELSSFVGVIPDVYHFRIE